MRFIWLLFSPYVSLWADWTKRTKLRDLNFWEVKTSTTNSWTWNCILNLRPYARNYMKCKLGNGRIASFWWDSWSQMGQVIQLLGEDGPERLGIPKATTVAEVINYHLPIISHLDSSEAINLYDQLISRANLPSSTPDEYVWEVDGSCNAVFSVSKTWEVMRYREPIKDWYTLVWYKGAVPKQSIHMWLTQQNRLPTRQRLAAWGITSVTDCLLCTRHTECRDHVMIRCSYARDIWARIFTRIAPNESAFLQWQDLILWTRGSDTAAPTLLRKIIVHSTCYNIWKQRNRALHDNQFTGSETTFHQIDMDVKSIISARRHRKKFRNLMLLWLR